MFGSTASSPLSGLPDEGERGARSSPGTLDRFPAAVESQGTGASMFGAPPSSALSSGAPAFDPSEDPFAGLDLRPNSLEAEIPEWSEVARPAAELEARGLPLARVSINQGGGGASLERAMGATRIATDLEPRRGPERRSLPSPEEPRIPRWPSWAGLVLGGLISAAAVLGPAGGSLSRFGPESLMALVSAPLSKQDRALDNIEVRDARVTLYPARGGRTLLVVAGEAHNSGKMPIEGVDAVAIVRTSEGVEEQRDSRLGITLTEDVLSAIGSSEELASAIRRATEKAGEVSLRPGASLPFMVVFATAPDDLEHRAFRIDFRQGTVAARP